MLDGGPELALGLIDQPRQAPRQPAGGDQHSDLHERRRQR
jgi:hypothetical protein